MTVYEKIASRNERKVRAKARENARQQYQHGRLPCTEDLRRYITELGIAHVTAATAVHEFMSSGAPAFKLKREWWADADGVRAAMTLKTLKEEEMQRRHEEGVALWKRELDKGRAQYNARDAFMSMLPNIQNWKR